MHLADQILQGFAAQARALQALLDQFQIGAKILQGCVVPFLGRTTVGGRQIAAALGHRAGGVAGGLPAGGGQLLVAHLGQPQPFRHVAELEPVGLQAVAGGPLFVDIREAQPVHLQGFQQRRAHLAPLHRDAELIAQVAHRPQVAIQHQFPLVAGGPPGDFRSHRGVAVPVRAHPGAEGAEGVPRRLHVGITVG